MSAVTALPLSRRWKNPANVAVLSACSLQRWTGQSQGQLGQACPNRSLGNLLAVSSCPTCFMGRGGLGHSVWQLSSSFGLARVALLDGPDKGVDRRLLLASPAQQMYLYPAQTLSGGCSLCAVWILTKPDHAYLFHPACCPERPCLWLMPSCRTLPFHILSFYLVFEPANLRHACFGGRQFLIFPFLFLLTLHCKLICCS